MSENNQYNPMTLEEVVEQLDKLSGQVGRLEDIVSSLMDRLDSVNNSLYLQQVAIDSIGRNSCSGF